MKDEHVNNSTKPAHNPAVQPLRVQCFTHKGELVVTFSQPVPRWFLTAADARATAKAFLDAADLLDSQEAGRSTRQ